MEEVSWTQECHDDFLLQPLCDASIWLCVFVLGGWGRDSQHFEMGAEEVAQGSPSFSQELSELLSLTETFLQHVYMHKADSI